MNYIKEIRISKSDEKILFSFMDQTSFLSANLPLDEDSFSLLLLKMGYVKKTENIHPDASVYVDKNDCGIYWWCNYLRKNYQEFRGIKHYQKTGTINFFCKTQIMTIKEFKNTILYLNHAKHIEILFV